MAYTFKSKENVDGYIGYVLTYVASTDTYTNRTDSIAFDYFSNSFAVNDAVYFGCSGNSAPWADLQFYVGTAMAATSYTLAWEYYNGSAWVAIPNLKDNTNNFTTTGANWVLWDMYQCTNQRNSTINAKSAIWVRCRVAAVNTPTEGGAQSTQEVKKNVWRIWGTSETGGFTEYYNADKAGTIDLWSGTPTTNIVPTYAVRPTDEKALKIDFTLAGTSAGAGDIIDIIGTDKDGSAQKESIDVSAGNATYTTTKWYASITDVDCNGFTDGTLTIIQNQWGLIWKTGSKQFKIDIPLYLLSSTFTDSAKQVYFDFWWAVNSSCSPIFAVGSTITLGQLIDATTRATKLGISFLLNWNTAAGYCGFSTIGTSVVYVYSCSFSCIVQTDALISFGGGVGYAKRVWNCYFGDGFHSAGVAADHDIFNTTGCSVSAALRRPSTTTVADRLYGNSLSYGIWFQGNAGTARNIYIRNVSTEVLMQDLPASSNSYIVNMDSGRTWVVSWSGTDNGNAILYRQYSVDLEILDENNNPVQSATVTLKDKNGTQVFSVTTDASGKITQQEVTYGTYTRPTLSVIQLLSPHTLIIRKSGFRELKEKFSLDEKIDWKLTLTKVKNLNQSNKVKITN